MRVQVWRFICRSQVLKKKEQELISKVNLIEPDLQVKVECQIDEQNQGSKVNLQTLDLNVKVELGEDASTLKF